MAPLMRRKPIILCVLIACFFDTTGQDIFHGSFLMSFKSSSNENTEAPMLWNIESVAAGGKMGLEIQDEMLIKGVSKRVIFNPADSTWTMLLSLNSVKQGTMVRRAAMYREEETKKITKVLNTEEKRIINGYKCRKTIVESKAYIAELWITDKVKFDLCRIYKLLAHCGMVSEFMRKGDWFYWHNDKGMILEVLSRNKESGENYSMTISDIKKDVVNEKAFDMIGFKISEIPEGQNCGVKMEDK